MSDAISYAIVVVLAALAAVRLPAALRGRSRNRSLWGAYAAIAAAWLARTEPGRSLVNRIGHPDLPYLIKHGLAIAGICVLLRYVSAVYADNDQSRRVQRSARLASMVHRSAARAALIAVAVMTVTFFLALDSPDTSTYFFAQRHAGNPGLAVYLGMFYLYMGAAATVCAIQWGGAARQISLRSVRIGLWTMTIAMVGAATYAVLRIAYVVALTCTPLSADFGRAQEAITDALLYATFVLWAAGLIAPALLAARLRYRVIRRLAELHPLWRDLALSAPEAIRRQPARLLGGHRLAAPLNTALDFRPRDDDGLVAVPTWYVTEIRDAIRELRLHAPDGLADYARNRAAADGLGDEHAEQRAEAYWIREVITAASMRATQIPEPYPFTAGADPGAEIRHLSAVAAAYRRIRGPGIEVSRRHPPPSDLASA